MDAECEETPGGAIRRERRWSMNSQRLEEIVAELMRPIGDLRHSFDTDLSALLEEYLTEAGLHALDAAEKDETPDGGPAPNFTELALLLQQSASLYGRKVDFLYQHVLAVSDSLHKHITEEGGESGDTEESPAESGGRRKRKASTGAASPGAFAPIQLEMARGAVREPEALRPPPTLPRLYLELEPRTLSQRDTPLTDHAGEPIGLLADFHVAWRLQGGFLVEDLEEADGEQPVALPGISLSELRALQAADECAPGPHPPPPSPSLSPPRPCDACASPAAPSTTPPEASEAPCPATPPPPRLERKRKLVEAESPSLDGLFKSILNKRHRLHAQKWVEFSVPRNWRHEVVRTRRALVLRLRRELRELRQGLDRGFAGFGCTHPADVGGFRGWRAEETAPSASAGNELEVALAVAATAEGARVESDDDGFFEQSSLGDCEHSPASVAAARGGGADEQWAREVAARAEADGALGLDVRAVGERVLSALRSEGHEAPVPYAAVLREASVTPADVSHLFLATLFLANAGAVRVVRGAPLALADFALQLSPAVGPGEPDSLADASPG